MKIYCIHHHQSDSRKHDWDREILEIWELQPDEIFCFCMEEQDAYFIFHDLFRKLQPYLTYHRRWLHLIMPSVTKPAPWPWVIPESSSGYFLWAGREQPKYLYQYDHDIMQGGDGPSIYPHRRNGEPDRLFVSYNNNPHYHRCLMIDQLVGHDLLQHGIVTFLQPNHTQTPTNTPYEWRYHDGSRLSDDWDRKMVEQNSMTMALNVASSYRRGIIDLVIETRYEPGEFFLTEKTIKPIACLKPFLALSCQGYNTEFLRDTLGYQLYDEIFDYGFDTLADVHQRVDGVIANLKKLHEMVRLQGSSQVYKLLAPKLYSNQHNTYRLYFDRDFIVPHSLRFLCERTDWTLHGRGAAESSLLGHMHELGWLAKDPEIAFCNIW